MAGIRRLTARARIAGMRFHQNEVRKDPQLLDWVLEKIISTIVFLKDGDPISNVSGRFNGAKDGNDPVHFSIH